LTDHQKPERHHPGFRPTGSGKTTTLYAVMSELNKPNVNIITVEDPVEYRMEGINQVQVNTKAGLTSPPACAPSSVRTPISS
jgi:type IV secretory pathway ATPase VirB11/archaellum biosynthesis ATPase